MEFIIFGLVVSALIGGGVAYSLQNRKLQQKQEETPKDKETPVPVAPSVSPDLIPQEVNILEVPVIKEEKPVEHI
jgi:Na+/glutamate symporter